ncbi:MAG: sugar ABC transporter substrate-binding protein [Caldilineae bacterium]|nr:MAG: sugar ABC transporter substrate-binding protein [Caldilineae bacterium]
MKTRNKRSILVLALAVALLAVLAAACAAPAPAPAAPAEQPAEQPAAPAEQPAAAPSEEELPFNLKPGKPYDGTELNFLICCATAAQFHSLALRSNSDFYEMTGIKVHWDDVPYGAFQEKLVTEATSASDKYDLFAFTDAWGAGLKPYMVPLDQFVEENSNIIDLSDYPPAYIEAGKGLDGKLYGLPLRGHPFMFFYRTDIFEELGIEVPTTWEEMEQAAQTIKDSGYGGEDFYPLSVYYGINAGQNTFWWEALLWSNGGELFDDSWKPIFNSDLGLEATERYIGWLRNGLTGPGSVAYNEQEGLEEFIQGRAAMFMGWWWMYSRMINCERAPDVCENVGFAVAPSWEGKGKPRTYGHVWPMGINKYSKKQEAAFEYMKWIHSAEVQKEVIMDKSSPEVSTNVATRLSVLRDPEVNAVNNGLPAVGAEILANARTNPIIPEWLEILSVLEIGINDMAAGGADVKATLDQMAADVEAIMDRAGYYK